MHFSPLFRGPEAKIRIICREEILVHIWMVGKKFGPPWTLYTRAPNIDRNDARIYTFVYLRSINWSYYWLLFLTCLDWCLVLLRRWKNLSHLAQKLPQLSQMITSVSPSSWLWQVGLSGSPTPPPHSPLLRRSTWSLSSTQRAATAGLGQGGSD